MIEDLADGFIYGDQRCGGVQLIKREFSHQRVVLLHLLGLFLEPGICAETDCSLEPLGVFQDFKGQPNTSTAELRLDILKPGLHRQPKVDLLLCRSCRDITGGLGDTLNRLDPAVHRALQLIEESAV